MKIQDSNTDALLREKFGNRDPFRVPDGYFEGLTSQIMSVLPPKEKVKNVPLVRRTGVHWVAAASIAGLMAVGGYLWSHLQDTGSDEVQVQMAYDDDDIDEVLDYVMMSNDDIATYLTMGE